EQLAERQGNHVTRLPSLDPEGEVALGAVAVARDDAPENAVTAGRQWWKTDHEKSVVFRIDPRVALVDPLLVGVLDTDRAEHGLDLAVEPDPDCWRGSVQRVPDPRLGVVGKGVRAHEARREQERRHRQQPVHQRGWVGPSTP